VKNLLEMNASKKIFVKFLKRKVLSHSSRISSFHEKTPDYSMKHEKNFQSSAVSPTKKNFMNRMVFKKCVSLTHSQAAENCW